MDTRFYQPGQALHVVFTRVTQILPNFKAVYELSMFYVKLAGNVVNMAENYAKTHKTRSETT